MDWLVEQEKTILERIDELVDQGEQVTMSNVKQMRGDLRVPAMYRDIQLTQA